MLVCGLLKQVSQLPAALAGTCDSLAPVVQGLVPLPSPAEVITSLQQGKLPPLPLPVAGAMFGCQQPAKGGGR